MALINEVSSSVPGDWKPDAMQKSRRFYQIGPVLFDETL